MAGILLNPDNNRLEDDAFVEEEDGQRRRKRKFIMAGASSNPDNNGLEDDAPDDEEDVQRRRKRPKKNLAKDNVEHAGVCQLHPLKIILHIYDDDHAGSKPSKLITLKFEYLVKLNAVCVGIEDAEEGSDGNILCNLFPDDTGLELPHQVQLLLVFYYYNNLLILSSYLRWPSYTIICLRVLGENFV